MDRQSMISDAMDTAEGAMERCRVASPMRMEATTTSATTTSEPTTFFARNDAPTIHCHPSLDTDISTIAWELFE